MSTVDAPPVLHPLEPLSAEEVSAASAILKAAKGLNATARFVFVSLHEPPKAAVQAGETVPREAFVVLYEKAERKTYEPWSRSPSSPCRASSTSRACSRR